MVGKCELVGFETEESGFRYFRITYKGPGSIIN